ncbi:MAG TPA: hypothetical protein V6D17_24565 [Candidatus Obscuribacterales bacterium]
MAGFCVNPTGGFELVKEEKQPEVQQAQLEACVCEPSPPAPVSYQSKFDEQKRLAKAAPELSFVLAESTLEACQPREGAESAHAQIDEATRAACEKVYDHCWLLIASLPPELQEEVMDSWKSLDHNKFPLARAFA